MKRENNGFKIFYAISFAWQLGFLIAFPIIGFLILGLWLDKILKTLPLFLILGIILGIITTGYEIYHSIDILTRNNRDNKSPNNNIK